MPEPLVMTIHVLAGFAWLGGALFFILGLEAEDRLSLGVKFARYAWTAIFLVFASGAANLVRVAHNVGLSHLVETVEGLALLVKIGAAALMLVDALYISFVLGPRLEQYRGADTPHARRQLEKYKKRAQYLTYWTLTLVATIGVALGFMLS